MTPKKHAVIPIYPFLLAIYPVIALLSVNTGQVRPEAGLRIALFSLGLAAILFGFTGVILRNWIKAAALTALMLLLFFSYGHLYQALEQSALLGGALGRHRIVLPVYGALFLAGMALIIRRPAPGAKLTALFNIISIALVLLPAIQLGSYALKTAPQRAQSASQTGQDTIKPDVYYIILDGYNRADTLLDLYGYDNQPFMDNLTQIGLSPLIVPKVILAGLRFRWRPHFR